MRIIISPAKKMKRDEETLQYVGKPVFLDDARRILTWMRQLSFGEAKALWKCNDTIARLNYDRFCNMDLEKNLTPALLSYVGIQYQYMAPAVFEDKMLTYVQEHLRILSGFYGVLKPMDGVTQYRLEMQAKAAVDGSADLYEFWGSRLYEETADSEDGIIINLASREYSRCIENYLKPGDIFITCVFAEKKQGMLVQKGTYAKMARGEMVRFMAEKDVKQAEEIQEFDRLGYVFSPAHSNDREFVFIRN